VSKKSIKKIEGRANRGEDRDYSSTFKTIICIEQKNEGKGIFIKTSDLTLSQVEKLNDIISGILQDFGSSQTPEIIESLATDITRIDVYSSFKEYWEKEFEGNGIKTPKGHKEYAVRDILSGKNENGIGEHQIFFAEKVHTGAVRFATRKKQKGGESEED